MQLTKQQKILAGIACFGLGAVVVDRLVLGPPESASADVAPSDAALTDDTPPIDTPASEQTPAAETDKQSLPSFDSLTARLAKVAQAAPESEVYDPFQLPDSWAPARTEQLKTDQPDKTDSAKHLLRQFKLDGTFRSVIEEREEQLAVINGRSMRVGERIVVKLGVQPDGSEMVELYELINVGTREVILQSVTSQLEVVLRAPKVVP